MTKLLELTKINNYIIDLIKGKQPPYRLIYSLEILELEILKNYFIIHLANDFIKPSTLLKSTLIFFVKKFNSSL